jgi:hypothetical protein
MTCSKGGLHCPCGVHSSDERVSRTEEKHDVVGFTKYVFTVVVNKFQCDACGFISVSGDLVNGYEPVILEEDTKPAPKQ